MHKVTADLHEQLVSVEGTAAPSAIVTAIQDTGRDAILRGSGKSNSAAVCILETHSKRVADPVRGLIRMVQVGPAMTVIDLSIRGLSPGTYTATVRESGDISSGPESTGGVWESSSARGMFGTVQVDKLGLASGFFAKPVEVWELIGRSIVVSRQQGEYSKHDPDTLVGVIARSAGVWDNDKTVCSCSGKTVWEERREQVAKGMI